MFEHGRIYPKHGRDGHGHDDAASQPPRLDESIKVSPSPRKWPAEPRRAPLQSRVPDQRQTVRRKEDIGSESLGIQRGARCMTNAMHDNGRRRVPRATASPKAASPPRSSWPARACGSGRTPRGVSQFAKPPLPSSGPHRLCSSHSPTRSRRNWGTPECGGVVEMGGRRRASAVAGVRDISRVGVLAAAASGKGGRVQVMSCSC